MGTVSHGRPQIASENGAIRQEIGSSTDGKRIWPSFQNLTGKTNRTEKNINAETFRRKDIDEVKNGSQFGYT